MSVSSDYSPFTPSVSPQDYESPELSSPVESIPLDTFYEHPDSARYDTLPSARVWSSPHTRPIVHEYSSNYEKTCKTVAIVAAVAVMIIFSMLFVTWGGFLFVPLVFVIGISFLVFVLITTSTNRAESSPRAEFPAYPGFQLRPMG